MIPGPPVDLTSVDGVVAALEAGAHANRTNFFRRGSIELVPPPDPAWALVATGDLHDNPFHLAAVIRAAGLDQPPDTATPAHLTLHELIHGDRLVNGMDLSYRVLARAAALKAAFPLHVHTLLANHELAQIAGAGITKDGVNVVKAFNAGVEYVFGPDAPAVQHALNSFIRSMPLAVRFSAPPDRPGQDVLCAHSLPGPELMDRFDASVLERELDEEADFIPRRGAAHLMVWGRGHTADQLAALAERWGVGLFILGHEKAPEGFFTLPPNAAILNSDHAQGVFVRTTWPDWPTLDGLKKALIPLAGDARSGV